MHTCKSFSEALHFLHQLTHNMTRDCSLNSSKNTSTQHVVDKNCFECQNKNKKSIFVHNMFWTCIFLVIQWTISRHFVGELMQEWGLLKKIYLYFVTQLFSLSVTSRKNWLLEVGFRWQEMFFPDKNCVRFWWIRAISFKKKTIFNQKFNFQNILFCFVFQLTSKKNSLYCVQNIQICDLWKYGRANT